VFLPVACCLLSRVPVGNRYRNGLFPDAGSSGSRPAGNGGGLARSGPGVGLRGGEDAHVAVGDKPAA